MSEMDEEIRQIPADKKIIRFSIKADDTEANQAVHDAFKEFAKIECDNNYTQALKVLLQAYEDDWRFEQLSMRLAEVEGRLFAPKVEEQVEKKEEAF
jgi:hypothetical protein